MDHSEVWRRLHADALRISTELDERESSNVFRSWQLAADGHRLMAHVLGACFALLEGHLRGHSAAPGEPTGPGLAAARAANDLRAAWLVTMMGYYASADPLLLSVRELTAGLASPAPSDPPPPADGPYAARLRTALAEGGGPAAPIVTGEVYEHVGLGALLGGEIDEERLARYLRLLVLHGLALADALGSLPGATGGERAAFQSPGELAAFLAEAAPPEA